MDKEQELKELLEEREELKEIIDSISSAIVFSPHDWAAHHRLAWIFGIVVGWDDESLEGLKKKFGWDDKTIGRLKSYHGTIRKLLDS